MVNIVIEPYEPLIAKAVDLIQKKEPAYFQNIKKIVVEPADVGHFGRVQSDQPGVIFISVGKLQNALAQKDEEAKIFQAALTLAHEMGHIKDDMKNGEGPAEAEEARMANLLKASFLKSTMRAYRYANKIEADIYKECNIKYGEQYTSPQELAGAIIAIVTYFTRKVSPEKKREYIGRIVNKLQGIDAVGLSSRPKNPNAGIGASVSLIKNLLAGHPYETVNQALSLIYSGVARA